MVIYEEYVVKAICEYVCFCLGGLNGFYYDEDSIEFRS